MESFSSLVCQESNFSMCIGVSKGEAVTDTIPTCIPLASKAATWLSGAFHYPRCLFVLVSATVDLSRFPLCSKKKMEYISSSSILNLGR